MPPVDPRTDLYRDSLAIEHGDWIDKKVNRFVEYAASYKTQGQQRGKSVLTEAQIRQSLSGQYNDGLRRAVAMRQWSKGRDETRFKHPPILKDQEIEETVIGFSMDFFTSLSFSRLYNIPPAAAIELAGNSYRVVPDILKQAREKYPFIPHNIIAFEVVHNTNRFNQSLPELNARVASFRSNPEYDRLSTEQIAGSVYRNPDDAVVADKLARYKDVPKKQRPKEKPPAPQPAPPIEGVLPRILDYPHLEDAGLRDSDLELLVRLGDLMDTGMSESEAIEQIGGSPPGVLGVHRRLRSMERTIWRSY